MSIAKRCAAGQLQLRAIKLQSGITEQPFTPDGQSDFVQVMEVRVGHMIDLDQETD